MLVVEVNLLRQLRHEYIVRYYDRIIDKAKSVLYIIMEYCENGDLASYIQKIKTNQYVIVQNFMFSVVVGIMPNVVFVQLPEFRDC